MRKRERGKTERENDQKRERENTLEYIEESSTEDSLENDSYE